MDKKMNYIAFEKHLKKKGVVLNPWQRLAAQRFLDVIRRHGEPKSGKTFLINELAEFINNHGNEFDLNREVFGEQIVSEVGEIQTTMSNADAVKVWLDLRKTQGCFVTPRLPGTVEEMEDVLYRNLTQRLMLGSQECVFIDGGDNE